MRFWFCFKNINQFTRPDNADPICQNFGVCSIFNPTLIGFVICQFRLFSFFLCFSLFIINRQTSFEPGIPRQDYGIIQGFVDKPSMAPLSSIMTTESCVVCKYMYHSMDGWMTCDFTSFSTVFQSYQGDGRLIMKGCVQWSSGLRLRRYCLDLLERGSNSVC